MDRNAGMYFYQTNPPENNANEVCVYPKEINCDLEDQGIPLCRVFFFESSDFSLI